MQLKSSKLLEDAVDAGQFALSQIQGSFGFVA